MQLPHLSRPSVWHSVRESLAIALPWALLAVLINPLGEFPLNDDWCYSRAVHSLVTEGQMHVPEGWAAMSLIVHIFYGALVTFITGFSFTALRLSVMAMGMAGIVVIYCAARQTGFDRPSSAIATLCVALNPFYLQLSYTFMTDVPFITLSMVSVCFFLRSILHEYSRKSDIIFGTLFAILATLIRQVGILIPASWALVFVVQNGWKFRSLRRAATPLAITLVALIFYQTVLAPMYGYTMLDNPRIRVMVNSLLHTPLDLIFDSCVQLAAALTYIGLFSLPLVLWTCSNALLRRRCMMSLLLIAAATTGLLALKDVSIMPFLRNLWTSSGLGPFTLRDTYLLQLSHLHPIPSVIWIVLTILGVAGATILSYRILGHCATFFRFRYADPSTAARMMLLGVWGMYLILCLASGFFDRYLVFLLPFSVLLLMSPDAIPLIPKRVLRVAAFASLLILAVFSVGGTHDYLAWNRARWQLLSHIMQEHHISPARIDGGFEFNGWYLYNKAYQRTDTRSWWWVQDDEYVVTLGPLAGYQISEIQLFTRWVPPGLDSVFVLCRDSLSPNLPLPVTHVTEPVF